LPFNISGYRVLVTASSRGIGRGIAEVLCDEGAHVVVNGRNPLNLKRTVEELLSKGCNVKGVVADLTVREDVERLVDEAVKFLGGLDALVYVTGPPKPGRFTDLSLEDWDYARKLLIDSAIILVYRSLNYLERSRNPSIVFLTSVATREPLEDIALSNTLRIAIHGLVRTLARELGPRGIRVNAVMPGYILTDRVKQIAEKRAAERGVSVEKIYEEIASEVPLGRIGEPREVGYLVAFLISPYASYINGASIPIDGGYLRSVF
jgi:3-oxoacyl-[acyl-carrier protein] reductase